MDNFFINLFRRERVNEREAVPGVPSTTDPSAPENQPPKGGTYQERIVYARDPGVALTVSAVYRAIELQSSTISVMPVLYQKKDYKKGNYADDFRGIGTRYNYLLREEPNPLMTAPDLWKQVNIARLTLGNGFVYIERDEIGLPKNLWLATGSGYNYMNGTYTLKYLSTEGIVSLSKVPRTDVLHFPNTYRRLNGFWGISTLQYAMETLSLIKTEKAQALETAAKGGRMKMLIQEKDSMPQGTRGRADQRQLKEMTRQFNREWSSSDAVFLSNVAEAKGYSMTSQDMQMIEQLGLGLDDVARFFATPRPLLMLDTNSHYNDYQNATMEYHTRTILPIKTSMEKEIARKLIGFKDYGVHRIRISEETLLEMDPERQAKVDLANLQTGVNTVNELRLQHGMPKVDDGDTVYISTNLAKLGSEKLSGEVPGVGDDKDEKEDGNKM